MSDNALVRAQSESRKLTDNGDLDFLENLIVPDSRFEDIYLNNENFQKKYNRMIKNRIKK